MRQEEIIKLMIDRNNDVHNLVMRWLNDSLAELNLKRSMEKRIFWDL